MLKFGTRSNSSYPLKFFVFSFIRLVIQSILRVHPYKDNLDFLITFLIFFSQSLIGLIIYLYYSRINSPKETINAPNRIGSLEIELISYKPKEHKDSLIKIRFLLFCASVFYFIGTLIRNNDILYSGKKEENNMQVEVRVRSIQIIFSSLLCFFTIRLKIYKHQKLSLIIISFFFVILLFIELFKADDISKIIFSLLFCFISCLFRSFDDVTEKYLLDFDYIDISKILLYEGVIGVFLYIFYFLSIKNYQTQGINLLKNMSDINNSFFSFILLIVLYIIISGLRNAYRIATTKYYSPMSRTLFEAILDPFLFLYYTFTNEGKDERDKIFWIYFSVVLFCLLVIAFFALVYNDFIIFYCWGLEYNTHKEINKRLYSQRNLSDIVLDDLTSVSSINE